MMFIWCSNKIKNLGTRVENKKHKTHTKLHDIFVYTKLFKQFFKATYNRVVKILIIMHDDYDIFMIYRVLMKKNLITLMTLVTFTIFWKKIYSVV